MPHDDTAKEQSPTEYERALLAAVMALTQAIAMGEAGRSELKRLYALAAIGEQNAGRPNGQGVLSYLAKMAEEDRYRTGPPTFEPFQVIDGGKPDKDD